MRKFLITLLLAGAAASPALAQHDTERPAMRGDHQDSHPERPQSHDNRSERSNNNAQRPQQVRPTPQFQGRQQDANRGNYDRSRWQGGERAAPQQVDPRQAYGQAYDRRDRDNRRDDRNRYQRGQQTPQQVEQARRDGWTGDRGNWQGRDRYSDYRQRQVAQQRVEGSHWRGGNWDRNWRHDRRYDWRSYRDRHRSIFRLGVYFDPFGYGYRSFNIGYRLQPVYFGQRYWIDPAMYQLPYPPPGTQWVRYWNDAVLVDMYTGEVVDVIHNFFW